MQSRHVRTVLIPGDRNLVTEAPVSLSRKRTILAHSFKKPRGISGMVVSK